MALLVSQGELSRAVGDASRLAALRHTGLLDSPPDPSFDRLTRFATRLLSAPIALISLVDRDRQFFKSCVGLPEPWQSRRETPLSHSFCQYVVQRGEPLVVGDAREHPLLRESPAIGDLGAVAYAGVPLVAASGAVVGSFGVMDTLPRTWTEGELTALEDLAAAASTEIQRCTAERDARALRQWTDGILEGLPDGLTTLDRQWCYTYVNRRAEELLGKTADEMLGRRLWDVFPGAMETPFFRECRRAVAKQVAVQRTEFYRDLGIWVEVHVYPSAEGLAIYFRDVTERRRAEEELRRTLERYRLVSRATHDTIWEHDLVTGEGIWSEGILTMFGYSADEVDPAHGWWVERVHPDDRERVLGGIDAVIRGGGEHWSDEYRFRRADGAYATVLDRAFIARNEQGEALRIVGSMLDITERQQAEEALRRRAVQLRGLADAALEINSTLEVSGVLQRITERARDLIGAHLAVTSLLVHQGGAAAVTAGSVSEQYASRQGRALPAAGSGLQALVCESNHPLRLTRAQVEAHPRWQGILGGGADTAAPRGWLAAPLVDRDGRNLGLIQLSDKYEGEFTEEDEAILVQLAQLASVTVENSQLIGQAQAASHAKSEFISAMSHEFRTPLSAIVGYAELLDLELAGPLNERQREQIERIQTSAWHLSELIEDILTFSRMEADREALRIEPVELETIVDAAAAMVEPVAVRKGLRFSVRASAERVLLETDAGKLRQILVNLLGNAVKFTDDGEVSLEVRCEAEAVVFQVRDTGIGIAPAHLERIFDPFWQVDQSATRRAGGTGLGLTVTRDLARLLGAEISVESTPGAGSTFSVRLPRGAAPGHATATLRE